MTTQIQVTYKPTSPTEQQEVELMRFSNPESAEKFLNSISKNPDVESVKKL